MEKRHLLIIVESLINSDPSGKTIHTLARETGLPASKVSKCISQYAELFVFPDAGKFVAINKHKVPNDNWRTFVVKTKRHDTQSNIILWIGAAVTVFSAVFLSVVGINL